MKGLGIKTYGRMSKSPRPGFARPSLAWLQSHQHETAPRLLLRETGTIPTGPADRSRREKGGSTG
eukprot:225833-Hanusia_phi.AAC.1